CGRVVGWASASRAPSAGGSRPECGRVALGAPVSQRGYRRVVACASAGGPHPALVRVAVPEPPERAPGPPAHVGPSLPERPGERRFEPPGRREVLRLDDDDDPPPPAPVVVAGGVLRRAVGV